MHKSQSESLRERAHDSHNGMFGATERNNIHKITVGSSHVILIFRNDNHSADAMQIQHYQVKHTRTHILHTHIKP